MSSLEPGVPHERSPSASSAKIPAASWYALGVLIIIQIFASMDRVALSVLMQPIKHELSLSDGQLGLISGIAFALFYAVLGIPLAWLADRRSRVKIIAVCLTLWSVMTALTGMARNFPQIFLARMGVGIGEAGCVPPANSLIGDYFPREKRALGISLYNASAAVGYAGGMILIGLLGERLGWRHCLQIIGLMGVPMALIAILTLREPARPLSDTTDQESPFQSMAALLRRPAFVNLALAYAIAHICTDGSSQWVPSFLMRSYGLSMAQVGLWVGTITAASGVLGVLSGGVLAAWLMPRDLRWEQWLPTIAVALCIPFFVLMLLSPTAFLSLAARSVMIFLSGIGQSLTTAGVLSFAEPRRRATAIAMVLFLSALLGGGAGPYIIGLTSDILRPTFGNESLRYAMLTSVLMLIWATGHLCVAARNGLKDRVG